MRELRVRIRSSHSRLLRLRTLGNPLASLIGGHKSERRSRSTVISFTARKPSMTSTSTNCDSNAPTTKDPAGERTPTLEHPP